MPFSIFYTMNLSSLIDLSPTATRPAPVKNEEKKIVASDNLAKYLATAVLPPMIHGSSAPPVIPGMHKAHANHLQIQREKYRKHFTTIIRPKMANAYLEEAKTHCRDCLPKTPLYEPDVDMRTGYRFTVPADSSFDITTPVFPRPTNVYEILSWVIALPLQTVARTLHVAHPDVATKWDFVAIDQSDPDSRLWQTLVWRETPAPSNLETFYRKPVDPLKNCRVAFIVQPPWILSKGDIYSFARCKTPLSAYPRGVDSPPAMTGAQRLWAKLWDTCVRLKCRRWVITTYDTWTFGAFSKGFSSGQVYNTMDYKASNPTVLECLTYHVASSINLAEGLLPICMETNAHGVLFDIELPPPRAYPDMSFPDSDSEWEGCDEEPGICAAPDLESRSVVVSDIPRPQPFPIPAIRISIPGYPKVCSRASMRVTNNIIAWGGRIHPEDEPPRERSVSPVPSVSEISGASVYASMEGPEQEVGPYTEDILETWDGTVNGAGAIGGFLHVVGTQGAVESGMEL